jgi:hypothetical protein
MRKCNLIIMMTLVAIVKTQMQPCNFEAAMAYMVRGTNSSTQWYQATDKLEGTEYYGTEGVDSDWTVDFFELVFDRFIFSSRDLSEWMMVLKSEVDYLKSLPARTRYNG